MFQIQHPIKLTKKLVESANIVESFDAQDLRAIGELVWTGYAQDKNSRSVWEQRNAAGMDLGMQIVKGKSFPWPNASNVAFPLVTIASMQFHAKAYPALVSGPELVEYQVYGEDTDGSLAEKAERISAHMSYQMLNLSESWESNQDSLLINYSIVGTAFKKIRRDARKSENSSEFVDARDLVVDYWTLDFESCPRKTHMIPLFRNDIWEKVQSGVFRDVLEETWYKQVPSTRIRTQQQDQRAGTQAPPGDHTTPFVTLEQHLSLDLDDDGYAEPYIITIEEGSKCVLQIACNWERFEEDVERNEKKEIIRIHQTHFFERYIFLPSPDGGIYGLGFGVLLGPLNEAVNSIVNQLIDAGTMSNTGGGFLGRGAKVRGGTYTFGPGEWKRMDSTGDDLRKNIVPLEVREPSNVLFQLLGLLIQYADRIPGTNEANLGENIGQNTPAETARNMLVQGQKVYAAIFKRCWRSMRGEFKKWYQLNALYLPDRSVTFGADGMKISRADYLGPPNVVPAADPNVTSDELALSQAQALTQAAYSRPGYNYVEAERRWLRAMKIRAPRTIYPGPGKVPQDVPPLGGEDPKVTIEKMRQQLDMQQWQGDMQLAIMELQSDAELNQAKIQDLRAKAMVALAGLQGDMKDAQIKEMNTLFDAMNMREQNKIGRLNVLLAAKKLQIEEKKLNKPEPKGG